MTIPAEKRRRAVIYRGENKPSNAVGTIYEQGDGTLEVRGMLVTLSNLTSVEDARIAATDRFGPDTTVKWLALA